MLSYIRSRVDASVKWLRIRKARPWPLCAIRGLVHEECACAPCNAILLDIRCSSNSSLFSFPSLCLQMLLLLTVSVKCNLHLCCFYVWVTSQGNVLNKLMNIFTRLLYRESWLQKDSVVLADGLPDIQFVRSKRLVVGGKMWWEPGILTGELLLWHWVVPWVVVYQVKVRHGCDWFYVSGCWDPWC